MIVPTEYYLNFRFPDGDTTINWDDGKSRESWLRVQRNDPYLYELEVGLPPNRRISGTPLMSDDEIADLGRDIGKNTHLLELELLGDKFNGIENIEEARQKFQLICEGICQNRSIETLSVTCSCQLTGNFFEFLSTFLENNINLTCVVVCECNLNREGMRSLVAALARGGSHLYELKLCKNDLVEEAFIALHENPAVIPKKLTFSYNGIDEDKCKAIATLLQDRTCTVEIIDFCEARKIDDGCIIQLANALAGNMTLKELQLSKTSTRNAGLRAFSQSLCSTASIDATYNSNHALQVLAYGHLDSASESEDESDDERDHEREYDSDAEENVDNLVRSNLRYYLRWNENENKTMVARQKVFTQHYLRDFRFSMNAFHSMPPDLLVRFLVFIEREFFSPDFELPVRTVDSYEAFRSSVIVHLLMQRGRGVNRKRKYLH